MTSLTRVHPPVKNGTGRPVSSRRRPGPIRVYPALRPHLPRAVTMRIWFTEIGEPLPLEAGVRLYRYGMMTRFLAQRGHDVTWWTSTFSHAKRAFIRRRDSDEFVDGVRLKLIHGPGYRRSISLQRIRHQAHFATTYFAQAQREPLPDIIINPIPTIEVAERNIAFGLRHEVPVITDIRDEWPDEFVDLAPVPLRGLARWVLGPAFRKMQDVCAHSRAIVAVSERQLNYGLRFANREKGVLDTVVPLGYSPHTLSHQDLGAAKEWWRQQGLNEDAFIVCLFSNLNPLLKLDTVIAAARILERELPLQIVVCGIGRSRQSLMRIAKGCEAVLFPGWVDASQIAALMEQADAGIAPYAKGTRMSLPNKPFEYMAGGLPVLSSIEGEFAEIVERYRCGITYDADSVTDLCSAIRTLRHSPDLAKRMGANAREALRAHYTMENIFENFERLLGDVIQQSSGSNN